MSAWSVRTVNEVASEVAAAAASSASLRHTRRGLRFLSGLEGARQLDAFLEEVASALVDSSAMKSATCLVLGLDMPTQAFFALAAVLVDCRLRGHRDLTQATLPPPPASTADPKASTSSDQSISKDDPLRFLCSFHTLLESALADTSSANSTPAGTPKHSHGSNVSVQLAVTHVAQVLRDTAAVAGPAADLLTRIRDEMNRAETASTPAHTQHCIVSAVQLTEQYAWLVLLEWYLWSPRFPYAAATDMMPARRRSSAQASRSGSDLRGFAEVLRTTPAAVQWIDQVDPWVEAAERCPDALHRRYSNGLRRWDDKHYVCFAAL